MKNSNTTYLYQYKNSSNYFFRLRLSFLEKFGYHSTDDYFVASLRTADYDDARWLALYIKRNLLKDINMERNNLNMTKAKLNVNKLGHLSCFTVDGSDELTPLPKWADLHEVSDAAKFKVVLKGKFVELLRAGKIQIEHGLGERFTNYSTCSEFEQHNLDYLGNVNERKHLIEGITQTDLPKELSLDKLDSQYVKCLKMLNSLVIQLNTLQHKSENYDYDFDTEQSLSMSSQYQLLQAISFHQDVQKKIHLREEKETAEKTSFFGMKKQFEKFKNEKINEIDARTLSKYEYSFELLFRVMPENFDLRLFTKVQTQEVKQMLLKLRKNESKGDIGNPLSVKTMNGFLSNYRTFFDWFIKNAFDEMKNPFANVSFTVRKGKFKGVKRRSFSKEEVCALLKYIPVDDREARVFRNDAKWYVPISLYSGMRLNEISALPLSHIKQIEDIWCFDLNGLDVKNEASERIVPIAQHILDLGFLDYVEILKSSGEKFLFPEIRRGKSKPGSSGWGDPISRWFNRTVLKNIGIDVEKEKLKNKSVVFHCNRRTMISECVNGGAQHHLVKRIVGHSLEDDITLSVYSDAEDIPLALLKGVLDSHLKWHLHETH